jgi:hypothetical protein
MRGMIVLAILGAAAPAGADTFDEPPATFHKGQFGLSGRLAVGFRGLAPRNDMIYCGQTDSTARYGYAPVCIGRAPFSIDLDASYGVAQHIEVLLELRIGLERDFGTTPGTDGPRPLHLAPGARFFFSEEKHTKLFVQPELLLDFAGYSNAQGQYSTELGLRALEGYWIDFHRTYGMYIFLGESVGFTPWLVAEFEGGVGIQGRYP